ncbi:Ran-binding protein M homolog [Linum perenne]
MTSDTTSSEMPMRLGAASGRLVVSPDKLSVKYNNSVPYNMFHYASVAADKAAPTNVKVYYFEMRVKNGGVSDWITIGFTKKGFDLSNQPGCLAGSIGYVGQNGRLYYNGGVGESYGPKFTTYDIVGAGIDYASNEFFFTKNGVLLRKVSKKIDGPLIPTVSVHNYNEEVEVNFGQKPFAYDIKQEIIRCPHCHRTSETNDSKLSFTTYEDNWKKILEEKDKLMEKNESLLKKSFEEKLNQMEKSESLLRKSLEEKEKEVIKLMAVTKSLSENL